MTEVLLARWQFGITSVYHFLFVPLTLGLSVLVAVMHTMYVKTDNEVYKKMTKFWGKLFLINFAMGVVTGIVQEFHFGMNWSEYSRFVGDIFGAPLAIEALLAFFLESTFLGLWIFGWDKLPKKLHALSIWLVAVGSNLSALWILIANSFMQHPVGYTIRNGRAEMTDFFALITNPHVFYQFPHTVLGGYATAAFFVMGISAYYLLRQKHMDLYRRSFKIAMIFGLISILAVTLVGHWQAQYLVQSQPMKMAAAEAQWETADPAAFALVAVVDEQRQTNSFEISIPKLLSFLSFNSFSGEVKGLKDLQAAAVAQYGPGNYLPPVSSLFWSFRIMVAAGGWLVLLSLLSFYYWRSNQLEAKPWLLKALLWSIPVPYLANTAGWYLAEVGRQPWIVYGLQKVEHAVSPGVTTGEIITTLIGFTLIYGILALAEVYLLVKFIQQGPDYRPETVDLPSTDKGVSLWT
ncbi:cytochrome ubiquinol oxidase subunit I [Desulforamulus hydrothermalis]|uniref:Cytochrome d ubiquinol oxidase subunit 1 n=1 Tax=Desulforamulus hydrothermalis Lam5 = DSM 18033 TaxID=1121428 RepID=K8EES5_9FIRM|nr:cytochrome ubiquinol oxidase subunit I [Desulforamulus hydrothermalis]CCO07256.1 Cytochrome d ubiquinol oxidase subunit 1 [Desulforamulus hydrothermalis Lam5 = DSM 18033]SHG92439.1 cytochrome bd-I ubiquinol oxidase subunit 1 apoprotein [Desulforamulus hydrothermalis Lam5 = DSM 18033]